MNNRLTVYTVLLILLYTCLLTADEDYCEANNCPTDKATTSLAEYIDSFTQIEYTINASFHQMMSELLNRRNFLLEELKKLREEFKWKEQDRFEELEIHIKNKENIIGKMKNQKYQSIYNKWKKFLEEVEEKIANVNVSETLYYTFVNNSAVALNEIRKVGEIVLDRKHINNELIPEYKEKLNYISVIGQLGSEELQFNNPQYLHIDHLTNRLYIADVRNKRVQVISLDSMEIITAFGASFFTKPAIVTTYGGFIYVIDSELNEIFKFNAENYKLIRSVTDTQSGHKLSKPTGIAADSNGDIYITDKIANRISIYTSELKFVKFLGERTLKNPEDVKIVNNMIYVIDISPDILHVFDKQGNEVRRLINRQSGDYWQRLSIDLMNNIIIQDESGQSVRIFTNEGELIHAISPKSDNEVFCSVAVTNYYKIIIGDCKQHRLYIY